MRRLIPWLGSVLATLAVVLAACGAGSSPGTAKTIKIGVDLPLTTAEARAAAPALNGIRFYVQTHPTLRGFTLSLRTADDAADPTLGAANVRAFLTDPSLLAMLGPFDAAVARQEIPVANAAGLAMISPATSNPCLTRDVFLPARLNPARTPITCKEAGQPGAGQLRPSHTNNFFRLTTTDDLQGPAAADYAFAKLHVLKAGVISDHEAYGQGLAYSFTSRFTARGGTVVGQGEIDPKDPTSADLLQRMKAAGAQAIYYGGGTQPAGCAIRSGMATVFGEAGMPPFLGGDGIAEDPACIKAAGRASNGIYATVPIVDAGSLPAAGAVIQHFRSAFGSTAAYGPYTIVAYDATAVLYAAIDQAIQSVEGRTPTRSAINSEVGRVAGLAGATGTIGFDSAGDTTNRVVSIFEAISANPGAPWRLADMVDYSARLPY